MDKRKVWICTDQMCREGMLIITDAPKKAIRKWCKAYITEMENRTNTLFASLNKEGYYVRILHDSELESHPDDVEVIGYDESYDLMDFRN